MVNPSTSLADRFGRLAVSARRDLVVTRQIVRGGPRYVIHDPVAFRNHALTPIEYRILCSFGFEHPLAETFDELVDDGVLTREDAEQYYEFVLGLHGMGLLVVPGIPPDMVWRRHQERKKAKRTGVMRWLVSLRIPFGNPDPLLSRLLPYVRWLFSAPGLILWSFLLVAAVWNCGDRVGELYGDASNLLALHNLPILWTCLVVLKAVHELGHAFVIKRYGGVVPDFGVLFMFMTPCAYVDANGSWTFPGRWQRLFVALGGMYIETMIAFMFALVWVGTQPGLMHDIAQNVVVMASITTVLININPLIKFDGYYAFSDLLGVVNLQERATRSLCSTAQHRLLGLPPQVEEETSLREKLLIWAYAPASFLYRVSLAVGITSLMMNAWPGVGVAVGLAFAWMMIGDPFRRLVVFVWSSERTRDVRLRARLVAVGGLSIVVLLLALLPVSNAFVAPGVLDPGFKHSVRAPIDAFVDSVDVVEGQEVLTGASICTLKSPELEEQLLEVEADLAVARIEFDTAELVAPARAAEWASRIEFLDKRAAELRTRVASLNMIVSESSTIVDASNVLPGSFVKQGDELMQMHSQHKFVRVVLTDHEVTRARLEIGSEVELRWSCDSGRTVRATVREIRGSASRRRVPVELTVAGGGEIYVRATEAGAEADQPYLHVFLEAESTPLDGSGAGLTARIRFTARTETLGAWAKRRLFAFFYNWSLS